MIKNNFPASINIIKTIVLLTLVVQLSGCPKNSAQSSNDDSNVDPQPTTKVALVVTQDRAEGVKKLMQLLDFTPMEGKHVIVKPNFNTAHPAPGSTHNATLQQIILETQERGATGITLAERSWQNFSDVIAQKQIDVMANDLSFNIVHLDTSASTMFKPIAMENWPSGIKLPNIIRDAEYVIITF